MQDLPEPSYRIVCYELEAGEPTVILDTTARAFIIVTGTINENGAMHGQGTHAGPLPLLKRIARLIAGDERQITLGELTDSGAHFRYTYDFGDDWQHEITVEKLLDPDPDARYPALVGAKGACPPEDCGGPWGYANLRDILADPSHDEHQDMLEWLGLDDATKFDPLTVPSGKVDVELALSSISG